jgi:hypothetical protein
MGQVGTLFKGVHDSTQPKNTFNGFFALNFRALMASYQMIS